MTIQDILGMDLEDVLKISKDNPKLFRQYTSQLRTAAIHRIERSKGKFQTPVHTGMERSGLPTLRGMDIKQVKTQFKKYREFLSDPLSTQKGSREFARGIAVDLGFQDVTSDQLKSILSVTDKVTESRHLTRDERYKLMQIIKEQVLQDDSDLDAILDRASERAEEMYQDRIREQEGIDVSDFFAGSRNA